MASVVLKYTPIKGRMPSKIILLGIYYEKVLYKLKVVSFLP